jgi:hypothetical protein
MRCREHFISWCFLDPFAAGGDDSRYALCSLAAATTTVAVAVARLKQVTEDVSS